MPENQMPVARPPAKCVQILRCGQNRHRLAATLPPRLTHRSCSYIKQSTGLIGDPLSLAQYFKEWLTSPDKLSRSGSLRKLVEFALRQIVTHDVVQALYFLKGIAGGKLSY